MSWLRSTALNLSHLYPGNLPLPASTYIAILLALQSPKSMLELHQFTELCSSDQAADFKPSLTKYHLFWLLMATQTLLLHSYLPRRFNNSMSHLKWTQNMPGLSPPSVAGKCFN